MATATAKKVKDVGAAERKYIADGLRNGNIALMLVGLAEIIIEPEKYQARVPWEDSANRKHHVDMAWVRVLAGYRDRSNGEPLNPCVVFWDPRRGKYIMADGFHRSQEARSRHELNLSCHVVTVDDPHRGALEYATMCNRELSKPRNKEDEKRAVMMLLDDDIWWARGDRWIADHVGVSHTKVTLCRLEHKRASGKPMPERVERRDGATVPYKKGDGKPKIREKKRTDGRIEFQANVNGKKVYLGADPGRAVERLDRCLAESAPQDSNKQYIRYSRDLCTFLVYRGIVADTLALSQGVFPGLHGVLVGGLLVTTEPFARPSDAVTAAGRALLLKEQLRHEGTPIVCCYPEDGPGALIELARRLGVEFLTPEELVERLRPGEGVPAEAPPSEQAP